MRSLRLALLVATILICQRHGLARPHHANGEPCAGEMCDHSDEVDDGSGEATDESPEADEHSSGDDAAIAVDAESLRHGLLMHGDLQAGKDHDMSSHNEKQKPDDGKHGKEALDADSIRHRVLIHGGTEDGADHDIADHEVKPESYGKHGKDSLDVDTVRHKLMHGDSESASGHDLESHNVKAESDGKHLRDSLDADEVRHRLLVHGDLNADVDHSLSDHGKTGNTEQKFEALDMDDVRHKLLMHGGLDADVDHAVEDHDKKDEVVAAKKEAAIDEKLRHGLLMHGSLDADLDHGGHEDPYEGRRHPKDVRIQPDMGQIRQQYLSRSTNDETLVVQSDERDEETLAKVRDRLKNVDFSKISPDDVEEFVNWLVEDEVTDKRFEKMAPEDGLAALPASLAADINEMKRRYLKKYYDTLTPHGDDSGDDDNGDYNDDYGDEDEGEGHGEDDILDVVDLDESDDDYREFVEKEKQQTTRNGL